ncbi:bifunctional adenosylcobinamide kinase/adenosylcobinamide-phosphate guanylyltransferase [Cytobacillus sp. Hz8]|uniref:bifunctional adenosylcobinamide kinase/adenosylcobinamide-phosphate guanylyltransferase n=1 Tax=Cytobacillus sp. Hz8 TaxID=3347168 RepID=UPI0035D7CA5B
MHFVTGGSFNGKKSWVKNKYQNQSCYWLNFYKKDPFSLPDENNQASVLVLEGVEAWIKSLIEQYNEQECRQRWRKILEKLQIWKEGSPDRQVVFIGADISKGIVPMDKKDRLWRDVTGWCYQDLAAKADRIDLIWYGINQTIK